ncbi:MAG: hypothetical protein K2N95_01660 [Lachnospiraceae bacterium]|nr:hypothetical protein [Lachnospiraceae bacterium]
MFQNIYPVFEPKRVLKKEMLENLRDYPRTLFDIQYQEYSDGILYGCRLEARDKELTVLPGVILFKGIPYFMEKPYVVSCEAQGKLTYLKVCFTDKEVGTGREEYRGRICLDGQAPDTGRELEIARFKLQPGARLRTEYVDFDDYATEFDTVNRIHTAYAAPGHPVVWPQILKCFAQEMMRRGQRDPWDCAFCMGCMQTREPVPYEAVRAYLNVRLGQEKEYTNEQTYHALLQILQEAGGNRIRRTDRQDNRLLMI